jgi:hypothetical protein
VAEGASSGSWEGKLATLKSYFTTSIAGVEENVKHAKQSQKDDVTNLQKTLQSSIQYLQ